MTGSYHPGWYPARSIGVGAEFGRTEYRLPADRELPVGTARADDGKGRISANNRDRNAKAPEGALAFLLIICDNNISPIRHRSQLS